MIIIPKSDIYFIKHKHTVIRQNKKNPSFLSQFVVLVAEVHLALAQLLPPHLEDVARLGRRDVDALAGLLRRTCLHRLLQLGRVVPLVHGVPAVESSLVKFGFKTNFVPSSVANLVKFDEIRPKSDSKSDKLD